MTIRLKRLLFGVVSAGLLSLYGCGGGSSSVAPVVTTTSVPITVIDGAIQNATVCLDKNSNGACDTGEPSGKTDAAGQVNLTVDAADVGKYPVIAVVGTDAIDADTGAVAVPFTLSAPADQVAVVSPLTTLVQQTVASTGVSTEDAAAAVQAVTGITVSLFQDYTTVAAPTDGSISAATVARMVVVTTQQQSTAIDDSLGTQALDGSTITQADLDLAVQKKLLELLPALVAALSDPAVLAATTQEDMEAALLAAATTLVTDSGLTTTSIATAVAINNQTASTTDTPSAGFTLNNLNFTDTSNFFARVFTASLAQNTPDANNNIRYVERRYRNNTGNLAKWGSGSDPWRGADLYWSGSAWANCPINFENTSSVRDAQGNSSYNHCNNAATGKSSRATFDIAGKTLAGVITDVRAAGYTNLSIGDNTAGTLTTLLGSATFPAGASLLYNSATDLTTAISYYPGSSNPVGVSNVVNQYSSAVSAGGDATTQGAGVGCNSTEFQNTNGTSSSTLEGMISAMTGMPCSFGLPGSFVYQNVTYTNPDSVNEAWANSTVSLGTIGSAPVGTGAAPGFYTSNTKLRMAFKGTGTNPVTYYACKERFNNGSTRNCTVIGTGSYVIATLGDARVMTLNNLPAQTSPLTYTRVFVERGGLVYSGFQNKPGVFNSARLNTVAATALLTQLGLTPEDPSVPLALTAASYQGTWDFRDAANMGGNGITLTIGGNGNVSCREGSTPITCSATVTNPATGAFTWTDSSNDSPATSTVTGNLNFLTGGVSGTFTDTLSQPSTGSVIGQRR
ncbi:hypothetical protein [Rhodoferax sp.]|uniref:hypothetical protein n=1 Tax=Rhodoferax sp. TaxID=50421 RepID=UPI0025E98B91|nr:hypothetical protein [Rhodoferax sp.]